MSPRRNGRNEGRPFRPVAAFIVDQVEDWPDGEWHVRRVTGAASGGKTYRCPGCDQEIRAGLPHLVTWPNWQGGEDERRHWHTACWSNRLKRGPGRSRY